ncbi:DUF721 domain-containing protein [Synechococcus moorigangaii CMS01]|nr:DUF721 domain-containing protein [Synechococcus moorigangaii CMS01]
MRVLTSRLGAGVRDCGKDLAIVNRSLGFCPIFYRALPWGCVFPTFICCSPSSKLAMGFQPVHRLLHELLSQPAWAHQKRFTAVSQRWQQVLPPKSLANSYPIQILDDVLWVATPNHTWSQHLNLQRQRLLAQLNRELTPPLQDIRFSTIHWHRKPAYSPQAADPQAPHPSDVPPKAIAPHHPPAQDPVTAVRQWAATQQQRLADLPPCPRCHRPTPSGELQRWQMCIVCIVQVWQASQTDFCLGLPPEAFPTDQKEPEK